MPDRINVKVIKADGSENNFWTLAGKSVYQILEMAGLQTGGTCAGKGKCGKCKVHIDGAVNEMDTNEQEYLMPEEIRKGERLACYCTAWGDLTIKLDILQTEYDAKNRALKYKPGLTGNCGVEYKSIFIPGRQNDQANPLFDRIQEALPEYQIKLSRENLNTLNKIDRPGRPTLELNAIILNQKEVHLVEREKEGIYGLALDLGTTSLFAALLDLESGQVIAMASQTNMQRIYGEDVISRLSYSLEHSDGAEALHKIIINNVNAMIDDMIKETGLSAPRIFKLSVVGNPIMLHFFLGLNASGFSSPPYMGLFSGLMQISSQPLGLNVSHLANIIILPQLGGFVGADTTACLLTLTNCLNSSFLLIDIGTNGEIVLGHKGKMWTSSAAAGPAFEGGAISNGMRAGQGAIEHFSMSDNKLNFKIIGEGPVRGICGSGVIDLVAVLLANNYINKDGSFSALVAENFEVREGSRGQEIILLSAEETLNSVPIVLNQEDIRQVQLAKGAIRTAVDFLLQSANLKADDLDRIFLAGAFGTYQDAESLIKIGLLPPIKRHKVNNIGNAAAEGAMMALMSVDIAKEAVRIKNKVTYVELANQPDFQEIFLHNLNF